MKVIGVKIKVETYKSPLDYVIKKIDRERIIRNPVANKAKIDKYNYACELACSIFSNGKGIVIYDDPEIKYGYHCIHIDIMDTDFEDDRLQKFSELIGMFDALSFFGKERPSIVLNMDETYKPRET